MAEGSGAQERGRDPGQVALLVFVFDDDRSEPGPDAPTSGYTSHPVPDDYDHAAALQYAAEAARAERTNIALAEPHPDRRDYTWFDHRGAIVARTTTRVTQ